MKKVIKALNQNQFESVSIVYKLKKDQLQSHTEEIVLSNDDEPNSQDKDNNLPKKPSKDTEKITLSQLVFRGTTFMDQKKSVSKN